MTQPTSSRPDRELLVRRLFERRSVVLAGAAAMLVAIFVAMRAVSDPAPGVGVLAALPIMLVALELGLTGGVAAAALSAALLAVNAAGGHPMLGAGGVATRSVVFLAVGLAAGRFSGRMRDAYGREQRLLRSGLDLAGGIAPDRVSAVVARAAARTPGVSGALVALEDAEPAEVGTSAPHRLAIPITARGSTLGELRASSERPLAREEQGALELLAIQAGLAADNHRLLVQERERAAIEAELQRLRDELTEHRSGLGQLLSSQEEERERVAYRLHDELAQVLSAVLMGLRMLARDAPERHTASVEDLRGQIVEVLRELRELAGSLRPVSLTQLGLRPALEALATHGTARLALDLDAAPATLDASLETTAYRIVEEVVAASERAGTTMSVGVAVSGTPAGVTLALRLPAGLDVAVVLRRIRARADVIDGSVASTTLPDGSTQVRVALPRSSDGASPAEARRRSREPADVAHGEQGGAGPSPTSETT
jgi:signal transduction histidine kinase